MKSLISSILKKKSEEEDKSYIEIVPSEIHEEAKVYVRVFIPRDFSDVKAVVDTLREGNTIVFVDIRKLRDREIAELRKVINRIKRTVDAIGGDIVMVGNEWIIATPSFARIYRKRIQEEKEESI